MGSPRSPPVAGTQPHVVGTSGLPSAALSPQPPPARRARARRWWRVAGLTAILATAIAVTAVITYTLTRENDGTPTQLTSPQAEERRSSAAEQAAAKERLCQVFNVSVRGKEGQGGVRVNGELNVPLVLRKVNSAVAV